MRQESEGGNVAYNLDDRPPFPSPNELTWEHSLRDGTHIIFPFDLDESTDSDESTYFDGPPDFDSDGNEYP